MQLQVLVAWPTQGLTLCACLLSFSQKAFKAKELDLNAIEKLQDEMADMMVPLLHRFSQTPLQPDLLPTLERAVLKC